jgi:sugar lactone lactonase YvrE
VTIFLLAATPALAQEFTDRDSTAVCSQITTYGAVQTALPPPVPAAAAAGRGAGRGGRGAAAAEHSVVFSPDAPPLNYEPVPAPAPPAGTEFGGVANIDVMANGNVIVFQRSPVNTMLEYDPEGRMVRTFNNNIAARPHGLRIDRHGNIWITDGGCNTVMKLSPTGAVLMTLGTKGKAGTWNEATGTRMFDQPNDVSFGPNDDFWVTTSHGNAPDPRVLHFDRNGKYINGWSMKHEDGSSANIHSLVVRRNGELYIADRETHRILVMNQQGKLLRTIQMKNRVGCLVIDKAGNLWMTAGEDGMIFRIDWDGKILGKMGQLGTGPYDYIEAHYMAISPDMRMIYVADSLSNKIVKYRRKD